MSALLSAALLGAGILIALLAFAAWAERHLHAFPFKDEDWLRYLLPSNFETRGLDRIMLAGPSTVRENFRYERFEAAFPGYDIYQGGISLGTLEDVTASLQYVERVYGRAALPAILVVGISPRVVANIPDERPFALGLDRYSPSYAAIQQSARIALRPKRVLDGALARANFLLSKSPERFRTGFLALAYHWISQTEPASGGEPMLAKWINWLFTTALVTRIVDNLGYADLANFTITEILQWRISPYKYSLKPRIEYRVITREEYDPGPDGWWSLVYDWDPATSEPQTRARLKYFADFVNGHGIRTLVINMPERDFSRALYYEHNYQAYLDLVSEGMDGIELIDLREYLDTIDFYDREHTTSAGSVRLSDEVIRRMRRGMVR